MENTEIKNKILEYLKTTKIGASSSEIAKRIGHNRITVTKYLEILKAQNILDYEGVAQAKLWYAKQPRDKPTILIVDDEPHIVHLIALSLIQDKYSIIKAHSGQQALEQVYKEIPDLVLLDLMMPGMNGYEVCQKLKENALTAHIPVMILSAKGEVEDKLQGLRIGADDYITKPFDPMELEARVERIIRQTNVNQDMHPLTRLPGFESIQTHLWSLLGKKYFHVYSAKIQNMNSFRKRHGYKKGDFVVTMMARILKQTIKDDDQAFLGHTVNDTFIAVVSDTGFKERVLNHFTEVFSYLYRDSLKLEVKNVDGQEYEDAGKLLNNLGVK